MKTALSMPHLSWPARTIATLLDWYSAVHNCASRRSIFCLRSVMSMGPQRCVTSGNVFVTRGSILHRGVCLWLKIDWNGEKCYMCVRDKRIATSMLCLCHFHGPLARYFTPMVFLEAVPIMSNCGWWNLNQWWFQMYRLLSIISFSFCANQKQF